MKIFNLSVVAVIITLMIFVFLKAFTYEEFEGGSGSGYEVGFALDTGSSIGIFLLLCVLFGYFPSRKLFRKR